MEAELHALIKNQTWELVTSPPNQKPIGCKWVLKLSIEQMGQLNDKKARLVVKGFTQ